MVNIRGALSKALRSVNSTSATAKRLEDQVRQLTTANAEVTALLSTQAKVLKDLLWEAQQNRKYQEVLRLAATQVTCDDVQEFARARQLGLLETVNLIADSDLSFARFGDGELREMLRAEYQLRFQPNSPELMAALRGVLDTPVDNLLLGFPHVYRDLHWSGVWTDIWNQLRPIVEPIAQFGNSHVSRPLFFQQLGDEGVDAWRRVWHGKSICIVTGRGSRFEILPALFSSAKSVRRVDSEPVNAFADVPRLLESPELGDADIFLVALGPAGTVLTHGLAAQGRRALDIGHLSDSYLNVFEGGAWPEAKKAVIK
ncbi:GT-D fold domain-containing glycosyltransferase [Galactobacter valiniphilus]|uniref:GT-D fold domain-containing glycosyltransferase n=1 Tax=Galactobacter valiniphilus TaxID=2676122 RepID=UPI00373616E6